MMASPLNGRVKRLEVSAHIGRTRHYALLPDPMDIEEWTTLSCGHNDRNLVEELKPLKSGSYVRCCSTHLGHGPLEAAIAEKRQATCKSPSQIWVCSDQKEASTLIDEVERASILAHALVFTDLQDEMRLGPGRHRIDQ